MSTGKVGFVSLVGAGPGDPDLITVGGAARLARADCVVYDRLANPALLSHVRPGAELIYAGKLPDRHTLTQDEINALLVERGSAGLRVVRLKGGDPFVFGRGGEEAEALIAAGIPFEVVPGVTSAIAVPAYAGIPVTHRAIASSFAVITGHEDPAKDDTSIDWAHLATGVDTLVFLMGTGRLPEITRRLIENGRSAATPAAVIGWGTLPRQHTVTGTLATIADVVRAAAIEPPAVTIIGEVAALREEFRWFDTRPLFGKRVLVTRTREQASDLSRALAAEGAEAIELPTLEIVPSHDPRELATAIDHLRTSAFGWVVFTSANAVTQFMQHLCDAGHDARAFGRARLAVIGAGTADALAAHGLRPDLVPEHEVAEGLLDAFRARVMRGDRVLLPRAEDARPVLVEGLESMGAHVHELKLYRSEVPHHPDAEGLRRLRAGEIDIVTFASSSSVRNLIAMLGEQSREQRAESREQKAESRGGGDSKEQTADSKQQTANSKESREQGAESRGADAGAAEVLRGVFIAAIGPVTAQAVRDAGLVVGVMADEYTVEGLVSALVSSAAGDRERQGAASPADAPG
jgi:uroporphyrinogen III methyltransferase/synthase